MKHEMLRLHDVCVRAEEQQMLKHVSLCLKEGEVTGLFGMHNSGKTLLLRYIMGDIQRNSGSFYIHGLLTEEKQHPLSKKITYISSRSSLIKSLTIWENMMVLRGDKSRAVVRRRILQRETKVYLDEYGVKIDVNRTADSLDMTEGYIIEILKAYLFGKTLFLLDNFAFMPTDIQYQVLIRLISKLKAEGVTFLIAGWRFESLQPCCDSICIWENGTIVKKISRESSKDEDKVETRGTENDIIPVSQVSDIRMHTGEFTMFVDPLRIAENEWFPLFENMPANRVSTIDFDIHNQIFRNFSVIDNICLKDYRNVSIMGVMNDSAKRVVEEEFAAWYGSDTLAGKAHCRNLTSVERIAIILYRVKISNPSMLLCRDPKQSLDVAGGRFISEKLREFAKDNMVVGMCTTGVKEMGDVADRYVVISPNGTYDNVPFAKIEEVLTG